MGDDFAAATRRALCTSSERKRRRPFGEADLLRLVSADGRRARRRGAAWASARSSGPRPRDGDVQRLVREIDPIEESAVGEAGRNHDRCDSEARAHLDAVELGDRGARSHRRRDRPAAVPAAGELSPRRPTEGELAPGPRDSRNAPGASTSATQLRDVAEHVAADEEGVVAGAVPSDEREALLVGRARQRGERRTPVEADEVLLARASKPGSYGTVTARPARRCCCTRRRGCAARRTSIASRTQ